MKSIRVILFIILCTLSLSYAQSPQKVEVDKSGLVHIDFKNLKLYDFIDLSSKILKKNILISTPVSGNVEFISTKPMHKEKLFDFLLSVLESKGLTMVKNGEYYLVIRSSEASRYNLPLVSKPKSGQMVTANIAVEGQPASVVAAKIRHMISRYAKLIVVNENNSLLLTDYPKNIETIRKVTKIIEKETKKYVKIIKLKNAKVSSVLPQVTTVARSLYNPKINKEKIKVFSNQDINAIIVIATKEPLKTIENFVKSIDIVNKEAKKVVKMIPILNSDAKNVAKVLNGIIASKRKKRGEVKTSVSVDTENNAIVLVGEKDNISELTSLIKEMDKEKQQVFVRAKIVEISENMTKSIGIKYGLEAGTAGSSGIYTLSSSLVGVNNPSIALSPTLLSNFSIPKITQGLALGATIDLLKDEGAADIVSEPSILCINNQTSSIYVGKTESFLVGKTTTNTSGGTTSSYKREDVGLRLKVRPRIANDNKVTLQVSAVLEDVLSATGAGGNPTTTKREVITTSILKNGETVILGGLIKDKSTRQETKVPLLGDIPILGNLFKSKKRTKDKINLVIVLTPYIVKKSSDLSDLRKKLSMLDDLQQKYDELLKKKLKEKEEKKEANKLSNSNTEKTTTTFFKDDNDR